MIRFLSKLFRNGFYCKHNHEYDKVNQKDINCKQFVNLNARGRNQIVWYLPATYEIFYVLIIFWWIGIQWYNKSVFYCVFYDKEITSLYIIYCITDKNQ